MKIISNKKYEEFKMIEKKYAAEITANNLYENQLNSLINELESNQSNYNKTLKQYELSMQDLKNINKELGDSLGETKRELKRLKTLLSKNKISYKKENK